MLKTSAKAGHHPVTHPRVPPAPARTPRSFLIVFVQKNQGRRLLVCVALRIAPAAVSWRMQNASLTLTQREAPIPPEKRGRGRPAIITLSLVQQVGQLIAKGMTEECATNDFLVLAEPGPDPSGDYSLIVSNPLGYAISAEATLSKPNRECLLISFIEFTEDGLIRLGFSGPVPTPACEVQASADLIHWRSLATVQLEPDVDAWIAAFIDPDLPSSNARFYRLIRLP